MVYYQEIIMAENIYAILLAAGMSARFGSDNKLLASFRGKPLAQHTIDLVCGPCRELFDKIFLIYSDERVAALAKAPGAVFIRNPAPEKGQGESVRLGTEAALATDNDFLFFFPCDQPFLDVDTVRRICASRRKGCIVEPYCANVPGSSAPPGGSLGLPGGSPSLFSGVYRGELSSLSEGEAPRVIKARHAENLIRVTVADPLILTDIDTREMLESLNL